MDFVERLYGLAARLRFVTDLTVWHKCSLPLSRTRDVNGNYLHGFSQVWRRHRNGAFEYKQDPETVEDFQDRQY